MPRANVNASDGPLNMSWVGTLFFGDRWLLYAGPILPTATHRHHAWQVTLSNDDVSVGGITDGQIIIEPDSDHAIETQAAAAVVLFVDPETPRGRRLDAERGPIGFDGRLPESWLEAAALVERATGGAERLEVRHPAVVATLELLAEAAANHDDFSLESIASRVHLSASRLSRLFAQQVGTPFKSYVPWIRMGLAVEHLSRGASLTEAAHGAGFTDSAHLNHVFRRMFGIAPSDVFGVARWVTRR